MESHGQQSRVESKVFGGVAGALEEIKSPGKKKCPRQGREAANQVECE